MPTTPTSGAAIANGVSHAATATVANLVRQAQRFARFATSHIDSGSFDPFQKALSAVLFTLSARSRSLAVPSKLAGVRSFQAAIRALAASQAPFGFRLEMRPEREDDGGTRIAVYVGGTTGGLRPIGFVQAKHAPWVRPLLPCGIDLRLIRVTGTDKEGHTLGVNVAFVGVDEAIRRQERASAS